MRARIVDPYASTWALIASQTVTTVKISRAAGVSQSLKADFGTATSANAAKSAATEQTAHTVR